MTTEPPRDDENKEEATPQQPMTIAVGTVGANRLKKLQELTNDDLLGEVRVYEIDRFTTPPAQEPRKKRKKKP
jgi:hypothetical protein